MKAHTTQGRLAQLGLSLLAGGIGAGCAHFQSQPHASPPKSASFHTRALEDSGLRRFLEKNLDYPLPTWPLESWDLPKLTLAAWYFHPDLEAAWEQSRAADAALAHARGRPRQLALGTHNARFDPTRVFTPEYNSINRPGISPQAPQFGLDPPTVGAKRRDRRIVQAEYLAHSARVQVAAGAWLVRARLRTNLLAYVGTQRRQDLLGDLESVQMELEQSGRAKLGPGAIPPLELSLLQLKLAETRLAFILALRNKIDLRERVAGSLGLPVRALLQVELADDFSPPASHRLDGADLRRLALRSRLDILQALADYSAAEALLRLEVRQRHPHALLNPGCRWDIGKDRWTVNLNLSLPPVASRGAIAEAEARRIKTAAHLLDLQTEIIDDLDRAAAVYQLMLADTDLILRLVASIQRQHDEVQMRFDVGTADRPELLSARLQLVLAKLAQLDVQERLQQAIGSIENAVQHPAEEIFTELAHNDGLIEDAR